VAGVRAARRDGRDRYGAVSRFDTIPSKPVAQAAVSPVADVGVFILIGSGRGCEQGDANA
jgi:hypothetical protein